MKKTATTLTAIAMLAAASPAMAAKGTTYKGRTSSGHPISFKVNKGKLSDLSAGIRMACIPIQGGGKPLGGTESFGFTRGWLRVKPHNRFTYQREVAFHYNEATTNNDLWLRRGRNGAMSGRMRLQYQFMVPKYPIGTFTIYSCLGGATFRARA